MAFEMLVRSSRSRRWTRLRLILLLVVGVALFAGWWFWLRPEGHKHCIKAAPFYLWNYAEKHDGKFPQSDRGWGDAMLQLGADSSDESWIDYFVGVDDDGEALRRAIETGENVVEADCTRIYVQDLSQDSPHEIAVLFDRDSVRGGDHFRGVPGQKKLREVMTVGGSHLMIEDDDWPTFVERQRELLRSEGFSEDEIDGYYGQADD